LVLRKFLAIAVLAIAGLVSITGNAASLSDIHVANSANEATVTVNFDGKPPYAFFSLRSPNRVVLDVNQSGKVNGLPLNFSGQNLVRSIRNSVPKDNQSVRLVFDLTQKARTRTEVKQNGGNNIVIFTITAEGRSASVGRANSNAMVDNPLTGNRSSASAPAPAPAPVVTPAPTVSPAAVDADPAPVVTPSRRGATSERIVVAIDAGHGGKDPGAHGQHGLKEKNVTISIARKLQALLNRDPLFKPVLTRNGDYFISVSERSEIARKHGANLLVSIHADAAPNQSAKGASVWVLANRRANSEMGTWLEQQEKQSELLGGAGDLLANNNADPYLSQAVIDLQFGHSQRVGYDVAVKVLRELQGIGAVHKRTPQYNSLGVLRAPDIPSLLVETGFISNSAEEKLLGTNAYQDKLAHAIYKGVRAYFLAHPLQSDPKVENRPLGVTAAVEKNTQTRSQQQATVPASQQTTEGASSVHTVQRGETLLEIANRYGTTMTQLHRLNKLKKDEVWVGQRLKIPAGASKAPASKASASSKPRKHKVKAGDTLSSIAVQYGVSTRDIIQLNKLKSDVAPLGRILTLP